MSNAKTSFPPQESLLADGMALGEGPRRIGGVLPLPDEGTGGIALERRVRPERRLDAGIVPFRARCHDIIGGGVMLAHGHSFGPTMVH